MDEQTLQPCPFCGTPPQEEQCPRHTHFLIRCVGCHLQLRDTTRRKALRLWNRRAAHSVMAGKVAELTEALEAIADHAAQLRKGTDDWFEMVEFEHIARAALAPHPKGIE